MRTENMDNGDEASSFDRENDGKQTAMPDSAMEALDRSLDRYIAQQKKAARNASARTASDPYRFPSMKKMYREANARARLLSSVADLEMVRETLETCRCEGVEDCDRVWCPMCWMDHAKRAYKDIRRQFDGRECSAVTILYRLVPRSELANYKPSVVKDSIVKFLRRCGVEEAMGGIEAEWKSKYEGWMLHCHLIMPVSENEAIEVARERLSAFDIKRPLVKQPVVDRKRQFTYVTKLPTYYRLPLDERKALPYKCSWQDNKRRLPPALFEELVRWSLDASFNDLSIRIGTRKKT